MPDVVTASYRKRMDISFEVPKEEDVYGKDLIDNGMTENISTKEQPTVNTGSEEIATPNSGAEEHLTDKISIAKLAMEIADISQLLADNACAEELPRDNVISKELPGDKASTKKNITEHERSELQDCNKKATTTNSRKRKAEGDILDIEKVYLNKNFVKPEEHRPWQTILESPDRYGNTIGKRRLQRFINFEKPTLAKLRRRQQRAKKNGWDTKKRKILSDEEVKDKLSVLWAELDHSQPDSPSSHDQLKQFVETD